MFHHLGLDINKHGLEFRNRHETLVSNFENVLEIDKHGLGFRNRRETLVSTFENVLEVDKHGLGFLNQLETTVSNCDENRRDSLYRLSENETRNGSISQQ